MALRSPRLLGQGTWLGASGHQPAGPGTFGGGHSPCPLMANAATGIESRSWGQGDPPSVRRNLSVGRKCRVATQGCPGPPGGTCAQGPLADEAPAPHRERPASSLSHAIQLVPSVKEGAVTHPPDRQKAPADNGREEASPSPLARCRSLVDGCWDLLRPRGDVLAPGCIAKDQQSWMSARSSQPKVGSPALHSGCLFFQVGRCGPEMLIKALVSPWAAKRGAEGTSADSEAGAAPWTGDPCPLLPFGHASGKGRGRSGLGC